MSEEPLEFYQLDFIHIPPSKDGEFRLVTAAIRSCELCTTVISGMGGGSPAICVRCGDALQRGQLRGCVVWSESSVAKEEETK